MSTADPYWKLRPSPPPSPDEICACQSVYSLLLCYTLSENPILCLHCMREVPPERYQPDSSLVDDLAAWREFYGCFYKLWLDSGEFEDWARTQLSDPKSPANERGFQVCRRLWAICPCYNWWFQDTGADDFEPLDHCPKCEAELAKAHGRLVCKQCLIVVAN